MPRIKLSFTRFLLAACLFATSHVRAQTPALTITPAPTISTLTTQAVLPAAVAYDASGNLYIADAAEHVILKRDPSGSTIIVAGDHHQDFRGDGGQATSASLDTPLGLAIDNSGNLYIADTHNHRIRRVDADGIITTVAGNGACGFSGDGASATSASLCLPSAIAVASNGTIAIADQGNHRIRIVDSKGIVTTLAGNGDQRFSGDGDKATSAGLDSPSGIAFDSSGNLFITDTHNQRIRRVDSAGIITTIAGTGLPGSAGDNGNATAAQLSQPTGITITSEGDILVADRGNHRIRSIVGTSITTLVGNGEEARLGDGNSPQSASLISPRSVAENNGSVTAAASSLRQTTPSTLAFGFQKTTVPSQPLRVRLTNTGTTSLNLRSVVLPNGFTLAQGSCPSPAGALAMGDSCNLDILFAPSAAVTSDSLAHIRIDGLPLQSIRLLGTGYSPGTTLIVSPLNTTYAGAPISLTATLSASGPTALSGSVTFKDGSTVIGQSTVIPGTSSLTPPMLSTGTASLNAVSLTEGSHSITASYSGDANYDAGASPPIVATITAFPGFTLAQDGSVSASIASGGTSQFRFLVNIPAGALISPVTFAVAGLPAGATATFTPSSLSSSGSVTLNVLVPANRGWLPWIFLTPLLGTWRRRRRISIIVFAVLMLFSLEGCGTGSSRQLSRSYNLTVTATAATIAGTQAQQQMMFSLAVF